MDGFCKAVLTAGMVWLVMAVAQRGGHRFAGMVAALPTITAPTLLWLAHEQGVDFAVSAAVGSVAACGMLALFALGYARAAQQGVRRVAALICGLGGGLAMAVPAQVASSQLTDALAFALVCCVVASSVMPAVDPERSPVTRPRSAQATLWIALATGGLTALAATVGPTLGGFATGLLSSLPLITGAVAMAEHGACGHRAAHHFLRGYVGGLFGKAAFGAVFALLAVRAGVALAVLAACACVALMATLRRAAPAAVVPVPLGHRGQPD